MGALIPADTRHLVRSRSYQVERYLYEHEAQAARQEPNIRQAMVARSRRRGDRNRRLWREYGAAPARRGHRPAGPRPAAAFPATVVQINPKNVTYEVFGDLGNGGTVTYADLNSQPIEVTLASLPWSVSGTTMASSASLSLGAQVDGDSVGCRILVDGQVRDEHSVSHDGAAVACTVTAA